MSEWLLWVDKVDKRIADLERALQAEQLRDAKLRAAIKLYVDAQFGIGIKLQALRALEEECK